MTVTAPAQRARCSTSRPSTSTTPDPTPANNNGSLPAARVTTTVVEQADVATTKTGPATVNAGANFSYSLTVANAGPSAASAVVLTDTLPAGVTFVSATGGGTVSGNVVTWPAIASLASGASQGYGVTVTAPATGTLLNIAAELVDHGGPGAGQQQRLAAGGAGDHHGGRAGRRGDDQDRSGDGERRARTSATPSTSPTPGPSAAAAVVVTDTLPAGVTFVSATARRHARAATW